VCLTRLCCLRQSFPQLWWESENQFKKKIDECHFEIWSEGNFKIKKASKQSNVGWDEGVQAMLLFHLSRSDYSSWLSGCLGALGQKIKLQRIEQSLTKRGSNVDC
jgi:hypothetical protein